MTEEISDLEAEIETLEGQKYSEILDLHKEANQLEFELDQFEGDFDDVRSEIMSIENCLAEQEQLKAQRAEVLSELKDLRTGIDQIEQQAVK